jgi:hypothetical protein
MDRRHFLRLSGLAAGALALPTGGLSAQRLAERVLADPYAPLPSVDARRAPIRVTGRVHLAGKGVGGVRVSDGVSVVRTRTDGRYTLLADPLQRFVMISTPAGHTPARNATGTARFYQPLGVLDEQRVDFELEPAVDDSAHALLLLADPQTRDARDMALFHAETVPSVIETVRTLGDTPVFGVTAGDLLYDDLTLFPEYERAVMRMGVPFYQLIGNHDLEFAARTSEGAGETFRSFFGPTWYSFDRGAVHYVVLDDVFWHGEGYLGYIGERQLAWLAADLLTVEPGATVVVMLHIPPISGFSRRIGLGDTSPANSVMNRQALYRVLEPYSAYILSGHTHELEHVSDGGATHVVNGAVCGAWWSGPICQDGTPNGYMVYDVKGADLRWRYQATGKPAEHQMRLYARGDDRSAPDEVAANIWAWDPRWTVTWSEDGVPRGLMARRESRDPMSIELHDGPDKPAVNSWVQPIPTGHVFFATPSKEAREITVEARDGWGRVYRETRRL